MQTLSPIFFPLAMLIRLNRGYSSTVSYYHFSSGSFFSFTFLLRRRYFCFPSLSLFLGSTFAQQELFTCFLQFSLSFGALQRSLLTWAFNSPSSTCTLLRFQVFCLSLFCLDLSAQTWTSVCDSAFVTWQAVTMFSLTLFILQFPLLLLPKILPAIVLLVRIPSSLSPLPLFQCFLRYHNSIHVVLPLLPYPFTILFCVKTPGNDSSFDCLIHLASSLQTPHLWKNFLTS